MENNDFQIVSKELLRRIEHGVNEALRQADISAWRCGAVSFVEARLGFELAAQIHVSKEDWEEYVKQREQKPTGVAERINDYMSEPGKAKLSERDMSTYHRLRRNGEHAAAAEWARQCLLRQSMAAFESRSGVPAATMWRFRQCETYMSIETIEKIGKALSLNPEEMSEFIKLFPREFFSDLSRLKPELHRMMEDRSFSETAMRNRAFLSPTAWKPFRREAKQGITSQGTLLKLIIALELSNREGKGFLALVDSGFIMLRDLVVYASISMEIYDPFVIQAILDAYSDRRPDVKRFRKLYKNL